MFGNIRIPFTDIRIGRFLFLFISMVLMFVLRPFLTERVGIAYLMEIFLFLVFLSAVYAIRQKKSVFIIALFLLLLTEVLQLLSHLLDIPSLDTLSNILGGLLLAYTATVILFHLFREDRITGDLIMGAICVYFLVGIVWALVDPYHAGLRGDHTHQWTCTIICRFGGHDGPDLPCRSHCQIGRNSHRTIESILALRAEFTTPMSGHV
jgi:hypothetical protein